MKSPRQKAVVAALCMAVTGGLHATTSLAAPEWTFTDDFESAPAETFWQGSGAPAAHGEACPGSSDRGDALVFRYEKDVPEKGHGWSEQRFSLPLKAVQLEISYDVFVPDNYRQPPGNAKNFVLWSGGYGGTNANIAIGSESWPTNSGGTPSLNVGVDGANFGHSMTNPRPLFMSNGEGSWSTVHIFVELARDSSSYGTFELRKDGNLLVSNRSDNIETNSGRAVAEQIAYSKRGNFIDRGYLFGWANGGFSEETVLCVDNFSIKANSRHGATTNGQAEDRRPQMSSGSVIIKLE